MHVEGLINYGRLSAMKLAGYTFDAVVINEEEAARARKTGMDIPDMSEAHLAWVRVWVDMDLESFFPAKDLVAGVYPNMLPALAVCTDPEVAEATANRLKGDHP